MSVFSLETASWRVRAAWLLVIVALLLLTRWPLASRYLLTFDSVNFALALDEFDPLYHQPQPPGYPLFVGLTRALQWVAPRAEQALLLSGIVGAAVAISLLWWLGERMFSAKAGAIAALLLLVNPVFWRAALISQVRVFLATASVAVAFFAWRAWQRESPGKWLCFAAAVLGVGAGFRPGLLLFLLPLLLATGLRGRVQRRDFLLAGALLCAGVLSWLGYLLFAVGGPLQYIELLRIYLADQIEDSSLLAGAPVSNWWGMVRAALEWKGLAVLPWIWALPFVWRHAWGQELRSALPFLAVWLAPGFLFHLAVHLGSPGHILAALPVLCLAGGWVLSQWRRPVWAVAAGLSALLFFRPPPSDLAQRSSYEAVAHLDRSIPPVLDALRELRGQGPIFVISNTYSITWRHLFYYFPDQLLVFLRADPPFVKQPADAWLIQRRDVQRVIAPGEEISLPDEGKVVVLPPFPDDAEFRASIPWREHGPLLYFVPRPSVRFRIGAYSFATPPVAVEAAPTAH